MNADELFQRRIAAVSAPRRYIRSPRPGLNGVDPRAWLADVIGRIADHPARRQHELLPWNWRDRRAKLAA